MPTLMAAHHSPPHPGGGVDPQQLRHAVALLHALNHSLRQGIIRLLADDGARLTVTEIFTALRIEQSVASQHLAILRAARLVAPERDGKFIYYTLAADRLTHLLALVRDLSHLSDETTG